MHNIEHDHNYFFFLQEMFNLKLLSLLLSPILGMVFLLDVVGAIDIIKKYIFSDTSYLVWLAEVMVLDLITGVIKVWKIKGMTAVTSKGLRDTVFKCIQYGSFIIVTHLLVNFQVNNQPGHTELKYLETLAYEFLIFVEAKSVYENIVTINPRLDFIPGLLSKLSKFFNREKKEDK